MGIQTPGLVAKSIFINSRWVPGASGRTLAVVAPAEGEVYAAIAAGEARDVDHAVRAGRAAVEGGAWGRLSAMERGRLLSKLGRAIADHAEELPFGGMKKSGHGREKGFAALHDFSTLRTMIFKHD